MNKKQKLEILKNFLKIKSVSTQDQYLAHMDEARNFLVKLLKNIGFDTKILKSKRHDAVFAQRIQDPKYPTVLIYGHYDVQPAEPINEWRTDPFEPKVIKGILFARGSSDDKGQVMAQILAVKEVLQKNKNLKLNLKFLIEGEEEIGSISINMLAKKYAKTLLKCNYIVVSDSEMVEKGQPCIDSSLRGLSYTEIFFKIGNNDLHSGQFGGVVENPAIVLSRVISKLKDQDNMVLIPGFYKDIVRPTKNELKDYKKVRITAAKIKVDGNVFTIGGGEERFSFNERLWSRPTLDVNGLTSGYQGEGSKTIIPCQASAKISMRLVPNQDPEEIFQSFERYVKNLVPKNVKLKIVNHSNALPYKAPTQNPIFGIAKIALKEAFHKDALFTGVGGSIGFVPIMANILKVPCIMIGFGNTDDGPHGPNEHFSVDNYLKGIEAMGKFYEILESHAN